MVIHADTDPIKGVVDPGPHQIYRNPRVSVEKRELGKVNPGEIRVEMIYAGICGSDIHLVESSPETGYIRSSAPATIPPEGRVIGHEGVGRVIEIGNYVNNVKPGDFVTFESIIVCHYCEVCRRGEFNQCRHAKLLGLEKDGIFGTIVDVPAMLAHDINLLARTENGLMAAACVEPAGVAYVACKNTKISPGDTVVIFGAGPIGLLAGILSRVLFGASRIHIIEPIEYRRKLAEKWSDRVYDLNDFFENPPPSVDVLIEASGDLTNVSRLFRRMNANGRIALLARSGAPLTLNSIDHMITNAITIIGSRGHLGGAFPNILSLCETNRIQLDEIVTEIIVGLEALCDLLKSPKRIINENCKVLVRLNGG